MALPINTEQHSPQHKATEVHKNLQPWLEDFNAQLELLAASNFKRTPDVARQGLAALTLSHVHQSPEIDKVLDGVVAGVPVRLYNPDPNSALPVLIYYHGGGHMAGSIDVYDSIYRRLAHSCNHIVIAVEYRLSPEFRYPAGLSDCYTVVENITTYLETLGVLYSDKLAIAGDSGGGALTASIAQRAARDPAVQIHKQVLIYPSLDYTMSGASIQTNGHGYLLESSTIEWYFEHYFHPEDDRVAASPLLSDLSGNMPSTYVITAGFCPLKDEGIAYYDKLKRAGVPVQHQHFPDMNHAFMNLASLVPEQCTQLYQSVGDFLNEEVGSNK